MGDTLLVLLKELITDFQKIETKIILESKMKHAFKTGYFPEKGTIRDNKGYSYIKGNYLDKGVLQSTWGHFVAELPSTKKIYEFVASNKLWYREFDNYEQCTCTIPSIITGIAAGFIGRVYEIDNCRFIYSETAFNQSYNELQRFFKADFVEFDLYINLKGVTGDIPFIKLNDDISIQQADFDIVRAFCINYDKGENYHSVEMFEKDYIMKIHYKIPKMELDHKKNNVNNLINNKIDKWKNLPVLGISGNVEVGKGLFVSEDWPIINYSARGPYGDERNFRNKIKPLALTSSTSERLIRTAQIIESIDFNNLHKKLKYSIERLKKSKLCNDIDDKVVELSIALEYLINTKNADVTLQLSLKIIKLIFEHNHDESIYPIIKKFYGLRSYVVHGNDKIKITDDNLKCIEVMEDLIQNATLRLIELTQKYTYDLIDDKLIKSLHISKSLMELLEEA